MATKMNREKIEQGIARLERQFMTPNIWQEDVWSVITDHGTEYVPVGMVGRDPEPADFRDFVEGLEIEDFELQVDVWCAQLSASGYMDQTELSIHETEEEAAAYLVEQYDTGEEEVDNEA